MEHSDVEELRRLRREVAELHHRLERRHHRASLGNLARRIAAAVLVAVVAFGVVSGVVGLWAANTTLNTDRWVATVEPLPRNPAVATAVAQYASTDLFDVLHVEDRLREALPDRAAFLAGPLTGQVQDYVRRTTDQVLRSQRFQAIWVELNRRAHTRALAIVNGTSTVAKAHGDHVDIDLLPLINQVLRELSARLPTMFGHKLSLPDLSSGAIPANLRARVQDALGVTLPPNFAQFTVYDAGRLAAVQHAVVAARRALVALVTGTVLMLVLAVVVSPGRRRTALQLGIWLVVAAVAMTAALRAVRAQLLAQVPAGTYRDGVAAALTTLTATLRERGIQLIWLGAVLAALAYLVGPGRVPVWLRHSCVRAARWTAGAAARVPGWVMRHRDLVRIAAVVVAAIAALFLSSTVGLLVCAVVLAAVEVGVTLIGRRQNAAAR